MLNLPIGTKVELFDKEGWDSVEGTVLRHDDKYVYIDCQGVVYKIPNPIIEVRIYTRGKDLDKYIVDSGVSGGPGGSL